MSPTNFQPTPVTPPATAPTSLFPALGPVGSIVTSVVMTAAAAGAGWLIKQGYIQGADQATVTGAIVTVLVTLGGIAYKALTARMSAKITAVAAAPEVAMVVAAPAVANGPDHADDAKVLSPKDAATVLLGKPTA